MQTNIKLDRWIEKNIDQLYRDENLRKIFALKIEKLKDIDDLLSFKCEYGRKHMFEQRLKQYLSSKLVKRRIRV